MTLKRVLSVIVNQSTIHKFYLFCEYHKPFWSFDIELISEIKNSKYVWIIDLDQLVFLKW